MPNPFPNIRYLPAPSPAIAEERPFEQPTTEDYSISFGTEEFAAFEEARAAEIEREAAPTFLGRRVEREVVVPPARRVTVTPSPAMEPEMLGEVPTPIEEVPEEEYELPEVEVPTRKAPKIQPERTEVTRITEFFRREIEGKFAELEAEHPDVPKDVCNVLRLCCRRLYHTDTVCPHLC